MNKINLLLIFFFLVACGALKETGKVLRNEKVNTTDEFLVKKKDPLVLPPDFNKVPAPNSITNKPENDDDKIKKIIRIPKQEKDKKINSSTSTEQSILNRIRK